MSFDFIHASLFSCSASAFWPWLVGLLANTTLLLGVVLAAGAFLGRRHAPLRGLIGAIGLVSLSLVLPLSVVLAWQRGLVGSLAVPGALSVPDPLVSLPPGAGTLAGFALGGWALGTLLILARVGFDGLLLSAHVQSLREHPAWSRTATLLARRLGIRRSVRVLVTDAFEIPCTWGLLRPVILLPRVADRWTEERITAVLLHELGHVRRLDGPLTLLARAGCAFFWFHPLAWWVQRRAREDAERACDHLVIEQGMEPERYARHLLGIVREARTGAPRLAHGMAAESMLARRIASLLDGGGRGSRIGWTAGLATLVALALATLLVTEISSPDVHEDGGLMVGLDCSQALPETAPLDDLQSLPTDPFPLAE